MFKKLMKMMSGNLNKVAKFIDKLSKEFTDQIL